MISSENIPPTSGPLQTRSTGDDRKGAGAGAASAAGQPPLPCPRCNSSNTKFCYYNNYSLSQPRHFCKSCRRYWTRGGALRNVPIGGGCRKSKKFKPTTTTATTSALISPTSDGSGFGSGSGFKMTSSSGPTSMEFKLGGLSLPRLHPATAEVYTQFIANNANSMSGSGSGSGHGFDLDLFGLSHPDPSMGPVSTSTTIESLSSINQEMHCKLQQQRLALLYGGVNQKGLNSTTGISYNNNNNNNEIIDEASGYMPCTTNNNQVVVGGGGGFEVAQPGSAVEATATTAAAAGGGGGGCSWSDFQFNGFH